MQDEIENIVQGGLKMEHVAVDPGLYRMREVFEQDLTPEEMEECIRLARQVSCRWKAKL